MLHSGCDANGTEPQDVLVEEHTQRIVSEILVQVIEDLPVFRLNCSAKKDGSGIYEGNRSVENKSFCEELSSNSADTRHPEDGNILQCSKPVEDDIGTNRNEATNVVLDHDPIQCKIPNSGDFNEEVNCKIDEDVINSCIKEKILFALRLSPVSKDFSNVENRSDVEKKKESVHFNSPVAVVYEFSERSEAVSDDSTEILSDTDSEDFPLSQTKYTDNLQLQNEEANLNAVDSEQDITRLLNFHETDVDGSMKECIMTPAGDCFNTRISDNTDLPLEQSVDLIDKSNGDNENCNSQSKLSTHCDNNSGMLTEDNEVCVKKETEETSVHLQKGDMENGQSKNDKIVCSPATNVDTVTMSGDAKSGDINPDKQETMESNTETPGKILHEEAVVESSSGEGDGKLVSLTSVENLCTKHDNDVNEVFSKFPLVQEEDATVSSQDLFINYEQENITEVETANKSGRDSSFKFVSGNSQQKLIQTHFDSSDDKCRNCWTDGTEEFISTNVERESKDEIIEPSQQNESKNYISTGNDSEDETIEPSQQNERKNYVSAGNDLEDEMIEPSQQNESKNYVSAGNDVEDRKENSGITENILSQVGKRGQSSPGLHCSQISKKSKLDTEDNITSHTRKRKLFKIGIGESGNVKLLKLDNGPDQSENEKVPKLLKQLASDVIGSLDETVIWDSKERVENHIKNKKDFDVEHDGVTAKFCVSEDTFSDVVADNSWTDVVTVDSKLVDFGLEKQDQISGSKEFASQYAEELQLEVFETKSLCKSENDQNTSLISTSGHNNCYQVEDIEAPQIETYEVYDRSQTEETQNPCESENDQNTSQTRTLEHINNYQDIKAPQTETSKVYDKSQSEETQSPCESENDKITSQSRTSKHINNNQDIKDPLTETFKVCDKSLSEETRSPCESENDGKALLTRPSEHIDNNQDKEISWVETSEICDESQSIEHNTNASQNILKSPGFISATELLSQSSQDSASTGFTVHAGDISCSPDSCEKNSFDETEVQRIDTVRELLKENSLTSENVQHCEQELEHVGVTVQTYRTKSIVEITEDGLKEEKLEDADVGMILSSDEKIDVELVGGRQGSHTATDQDEQIDTDELDMYVDRAVDQIVPDDCAGISDGIVETDEEQALLIKDEDQKPKLYACDLDICNEQDDPLCKSINKSGKSYEKCFNWKYRPSCDVDSDVHLPELPDEDHTVMITPLKTCGKPLRLGLSKRQPVKNSLHKLGIRK